LFRDAPDVKTRGRYYFSPDDTPMVSGFHHLGSRTWLDGNAVLVQNLGEDLTSPHKWYAGAPPADVPSNFIVGTAACIRDGESVQHVSPDADLIDGFPSACFVAPRVDVWPYVATVTRCSLQRFYARLIEWLYDDDGAAIEEAFQLLLGPAAVVRVHPQVMDFPAIATCVIDDIMVVVLDGTRTFQQIALQGMYSLRSPQNFGILGTNPFWYLATSYVLGVLQSDGLAAGMRVMFAGHSFGAACALIAAARLEAWDAMPDIRYLTYGCPKPGNMRMQALTEQLVGINLANDDDIITVFPPDGVTMQVVMQALGAPQLAVWFDWFRPGNQLLQLSDGTTRPNNFPFLDFFTLTNVANDVLGSVPIAPVTGHTITEYYRRIDLRCGGAEWPVNEELSDFLDEEGWGDGGIQIGGTGQVPSVVSGGLELGGTAEPPPAPGGLELGGGTPILPGGVEIGGTAEPPAAPGGVEIGGTAEPPAAPGGVEIGGTAERLKLGRAG